MTLKHVPHLWLLISYGILNYISDGIICRMMGLFGSIFMSLFSKIFRGSSVWKHVYALSLWNLSARFQHIIYQVKNTHTDKPMLAENYSNIWQKDQSYTIHLSSQVTETISDVKTRYKITSIELVLIRKRRYLAAE